MTNKCLECGINVICDKYHPNRKYCSTKCIQLAWRKRNREKCKILSKKYRDDNPYKMRQFVKDWESRNKERVKFLKKRWNINNPNYHKKFNKKYNNTENHRARSKANYHIKITNEQICEICKINKAIERHHLDYNKPLEVMFLCKKCHTQKREWIKPFKKNHTIRRRYKINAEKNKLVSSFIYSNDFVSCRNCLA